MPVLATPDDPGRRFARRRAGERHIVAFVDGDVGRAALVDNVRRHLDLDTSQLFLHRRRVDLIDFID